MNETKEKNFIHFTVHGNDINCVAGICKFGSTD